MTKTISFSSWYPTKDQEIIPPTSKTCKREEIMWFFWNKSLPSHCSLFHVHLRISFSLLHKVCCKTFFLRHRVTGEFSITDSLKHLHWYFYFQPFLQYFRGVWSSFRWLRDKTTEKEEGMVPPVTRLLACERMKQLISSWNHSRPVSAAIRTHLGSTPTRQPPSLTTGITL